MECEWVTASAEVFQLVFLTLEGAPLSPAAQASVEELAPGVTYVGDTNSTYVYFSSPHGISYGRIVGQRLAPAEAAEAAAAIVRKSYAFNLLHGNDFLRAELEAEAAVEGGSPHASAALRTRFARPTGFEGQCVNEVDMR